MGSSDFADSVEPDVVKALTAHIFSSAVRIDANQRSNMAVHLAILTLLIDAKIITIEEAASRIEQIPSVLPKAYQGEDVSMRLKWFTTWLRANAKQPPRQWNPVVIDGGLDNGKNSDP